MKQNKNINKYKYLLEKNKNKQLNLKDKDLIYQKLYYKNNKVLLKFNKIYIIHKLNKKK